MAKNTRLQGFAEGAKQVADFMKGQLVTQKQFEKGQEAFKKQMPKIKQGSAEYYELNDEGQKAIDRKYAELGDIATVAVVRKKVSENYVAFVNYTKQMQEFYSNKKRSITEGELYQLAANNRAVKKLNLHGGNVMRYGQKSSDAITKFLEIIMDNDFKKLQYLSRFPREVLKNATIEQIQKISLPVVEAPPAEENFDKLKRDMQELSKRLEELDANRHVNSSEFNKMKAAVNALTKTLETPWAQLEEAEYATIGQRLEAVQAASMNYVKAKGVGRQYTTLGQDRMEFALDVVEKSAAYMDIFISRERKRAITNFEEDIMKCKVSETGCCKNYTLATDFFTSKRANIFADKERGLDEFGDKIDDELKDDDDEKSMSDDDDELDDDDDELDDEL